MSKTVLVTGSRGFLARHLLTALEKKGYNTIAVNHDTMELTDPKSVMDTIRELKPDFVVNCAAISSTGYCAEHPEESYSVNVMGPVNLALACRETGCGLIFCSSDQVYAGCTIWGPLPEDLELKPNNVYGKDKLLMESKVLEILPEAIGLRLTWMFEKYNPQNPHTDMMSRLETMSASGEETIKASVKELRGISNVDEVAQNITLLLDGVPGGIYNFGSENSLTTYQTLCKVVPEFGISSQRVIADDSWGRNLSMDCRKIASYGIRFRTTEEALTGKGL